MRMSECEVLRRRILGTDLEQFAYNDSLLQYALDYAESEILKRRGSDALEAKYRINRIEGAVWYLARIGAEGAQSVSENGVSVSYQEVPDWLISVIPLLK